MMNRTLKVLVLEDDPVLRDALALQLQQDPQITTCQAETLVEAGTMARKESHFTILADLSLADAKGLDAIYLMKRVIPGATIIVITGASSEVQKQALEAGAHAVIEKASEQSHGQALIDVIRKAVTAHDMELICMPAYDRADKIEDLLTKIKEGKP